MELFISWSGPRSKAAAEALRDWLPKLINAVRPWLSCADIDKGARWSIDIATRLANASVGILCLTPGNIRSDWLIFEAGALSKTLEDTHVCPLLFGLEPADVAGPLAQFQATRATREEMRALITTINRALEDDALSEKHLDEVFNVWWPKLDAQFAQLPPEAPPVPHPERTDRNILEEILALVRSGARSVQPFCQADIGASEVLRLVWLEAQQQGIQFSSIEPVYSQMPPPPGEPHVVRVRAKTGKTYVVRTPMELGRRTVTWMIRADLQKELEFEQKAMARNADGSGGRDAASPQQAGLGKP
jgi:hypothetical protein